jgi:hypothetical protein
MAACVGRATIGHGAVRGGVVMMIIVVVIPAAIRSIKSDIDHRTAGVIAGITRAVITDVSRASCQ